MIACTVLIKRYDCMHCLNVMAINHFVCCLYLCEGIKGLACVAEKQEETEKQRERERKTKREIENKR